MEPHQRTTTPTGQRPPGEGRSTMLTALRALVEDRSDAPMLIDALDDGARSLSRAQVWQRTVALRQELEAHGVGSGDCVAVWLPNWSDSVIWQLATASLGAHVIGVNTRYNITEIAHVLEMARPRVMAVAHRFLTIDFCRTLHDSAARASAPRPSIAVVTGPGDTEPVDEQTRRAHDIGSGVWVPRSPSAEGPLAAAPEDLERPENLVVAFTTSGSTGLPKLAAHSSRGVLHHAQQVAAHGGYGPGTVNLTVLPLSGVFGHAPAMAALFGGGVCLLEPRFDDRRIVQDMAEHRVTHVVGGDDIVRRIAQAWEAEAADLSAWQVLLIADLHGGAAGLCAWAEENFGVWAAGVYGSSELFALAAFWPKGEDVSRRWTGGGRLVSEQAEVRAADPVTGEVRTAGGPGELQFRGPNVVDAYLGNEAAFEEAFSNDGWFRTGDLGQIAEDGAVTYAMRLGDVLRLRGFLVKPAEIENRIVEHPQVSSVKVVGLTTDSGETRAVGFVTLHPGGSTDENELRRWCAQTLAPFKVPTRVHALEAMPTTTGTNGSKIRTATLREMAQQLYDQEVSRELS